MRVIHERKCRRLKDLDESGAEAHKIESTRTLIRKLSTKIRIALHFVDSISSKISKLRDEDLWPQIDQLIQGYVIHSMLLVLWTSISLLLWASLEYFMFFQSFAVL